MTRLELIGKLLLLGGKFTFGDLDEARGTTDVGVEGDSYLGLYRLKRKGLVLATSYDDYELTPKAIAAFEKGEEP